MPDVLLRLLLPFHGCRDGCFISKGYDPTTHFETTVEDVLGLYKRITGGTRSRRTCETAEIAAWTLLFLTNLRS